MFKAVIVKQRNSRAQQAAQKAKILRGFSSANVARKFVPVVRQLSAGNVDSQAAPGAGPFQRSTWQPFGRAASVRRRVSNCQSSVQASRFAPCRANRPARANPSPLPPLRSHCCSFQNRELRRCLFRLIGGQQNAIRFVLAAPDPAPKLMQLRQTKSLGIFNQHHGSRSEHRHRPRSRSC